MSRQALFAAIQSESQDFQNELARVAVAADLNVLLGKAAVSRSELATRLGWTRPRITQVLSGEGNLTIDTVSAVARALGYSFDLVFRETNERRAVQPWEHGVRLELSDSDNLEFPSARNVNCHLRAVLPSPAMTASLKTESNSTNEGDLEWAHAA
jgi:transcriptional regulator with XRE-family HTH domain